MISQSNLIETLDYSPTNGVFTWKVRRNGIQRGSIAGWVSASGHLQITINGKHYYAHRLAWLYVHGYLPSGQIDHINRDKLDNRISNLRDSSHSENQWNVGLKNTNTSGFKGVSYAYRQKKWRAAITTNKKSKHIGYFDTKERASIAYRLAEYFREKYSQLD
jgi:hypothetical protein